MIASATVLSRARRAVSISFLANGLVFGTWAARIPQIKANLGLSDAALGFALLWVAVGAVAAMPLTGGLIGRYGSRNMTLVGTLVMAMGLAIAGFAPSLPVLIAGLAALGAGSGMEDVSMNAHGVEAERRYGRPILSGFHAIFSIGGMVGAAVGGLLAGAGLNVGVHLALTAALLVLLGAAAWAWMLPGHVDRVVAAPLLQRPSMAVVGLGLLAFGAMIAEGSVADWSAVLMSGSLGADAATAAFAFAGFSLTMTGGRFAGDAVVHRFGPVDVTRWGAVIAMAGFVIALLLGTPVGGIVGFAVAGIGLASMVPVIYRAAGHIPGVSPGAGIAAATTLGYLGFVVGPPLIGFVAGQVGLRLALGTMILLLALVATFADRTQSATVEGATST